MTDKKFYKRVTNSTSDLIGKFLKILHKEKIPYCVIGGVGLNAYCEPIVTLDFDCVVVVERIEGLKDKLRRDGLKVKAHPHTWEFTHQTSDIRICMMPTRVN